MADGRGRLVVERPSAGWRYDKGEYEIVVPPKNADPRVFPRSTFMNIVRTLRRPGR